MEQRDYLLTVNRRLARTRKREIALKNGPFADFHGIVIAWDDFIRQCFDAARLQGAGLALLTPLQTQWLWAEAMQSLPTLGFAREQTLDAAQDAHGLLTAYRLDPNTLYGYKEDTDLFLDALRRVETLAKEHHAMPSAWVSDWLLTHPTYIPAMKMCTLRCDGFDAWTPMQQALLAQWEAHGVKVLLHEPTTYDATVRKLSCETREAEWYQAAMFAKEKAQQGRTVGIVIPTLQQDWHHLSRVLWEVFGEARPYNVSSGVSLAKQPIVHALLSTLTLCDTAIPMRVWGLLLQSPFINGGDEEGTLRALFYTRLCHTQALALTIDDVLATHDIPPLFEGQLRGAQQMIPRKRDTQSMRDWVIWLHAWIVHWGWGSARTLSSEEYQAIQMFQDTMPALYGLDRLQQGFAWGMFREQMHALIHATLFQPETQDKPIQLLGLLEAAGIAFDHLWITGLTADTFPSKTAPNPFIPTQLQAKHNMPRSTPERELCVAKQLLHRLMTGSQDVTLSYAMMDAAGEVQHESPLIAVVPLDAGMRATMEIWGARMLAASHDESYEDEHGLPLNGGYFPGGSGVLKAQAACPHRAYVQYRLQGKRLPKPEMGLSALKKGSLIHAVLERFWLRVKTRDGLIRLDQAALQQALADDIDTVLAAHRPPLSPANHTIEAKRMRGLLLTWLDKEKERESFTVSAVEKEIEATLGSLTLRLKMDRVDEIGPNQWLLIDYKTGSVSNKAWQTPRMDEPQLPLYAVLMSPAPAGIAFAGLKKNEQSFIYPDKAITWEACLDEFRNDLNGLADNLTRGDAVHDPKYGKRTCLDCDLNQSCRIFLGGLHE